MYGYGGMQENGYGYKNPSYGGGYDNGGSRGYIPSSNKNAKKTIKRGELLIRNDPNPAKNNSEEYMNMFKMEKSKAYLSRTNGMEHSQEGKDKSKKI